MFLFFDTETTGLPRNWQAPITDLDNWPRMVQLACLFYDDQGTRLAQEDFIIRPEGYLIPEDASRIHGISHARAMAEGVPLRVVLDRFSDLAARASVLVAHNMAFDEKIVGAEFLRSRRPDPVATRRRICTMLGSTEYCRLPGKYGNKWPKLTELHMVLFGHGFDEAHNAAVDINATARCFWELRKRSVL
ncbi:MAG: exonuclease domain-containing protein [Bacteroidota bacterium]